MTLEITATALPRIMKCDGPIALADYSASDNQITDSIIEGNAAHKLMQLAIANGQDCAEFIGQKVNDNYIITDEMVDYIQPCVDALLDSDNIQIEEKTDWSTQHGAIIRSRADFISTKGNILRIPDLKYGWRIVEPENNWTLLSYAIGFCIRTGFQPDRIELIIHQPRPWHNKGTVRTWPITFEQLREYQELINVRLASIDNTMTTGPHCYKCPVAHACPSARLAALNAVDISVSSEPEQMTGQLLGYELSLLERAQRVLDLRYKALSSQAEQMLQSGQQVTGYGLDFAFGRKKWRDGIDASTVQMLTGVDISKQEMLTPSQAQKKGVSKQIIEQLTETPSRGFKLVSMDLDTTAKEMFK